MNKRILILLCSVVFMPSFVAAADGALYLSPERGSYSIGDVFEVDVLANTDRVQVSGAEADLTFNPAALAVERISTDGSSLSLWPTPPTYSNTKGTVQFSGTASESFSSDKAPLIHIQFRAKSALPGDIHFDSGALLAADARATNIITSMRSGLYTFAAHETQPVVESTSSVPESPDAPVPEVKGASIQVPTIAWYDDYVRAGTHIVLDGSATKDSTLTVYVQYENEAPAESVVHATADGTYTFVSKDAARVGTYQAWAEVQTGSESLTSDKITTVVTRDSFAAAIMAMGPVAMLSIPGALLLVLAGFLTGFLYLRRSTSKVEA